MALATRSRGGVISTTGQKEQTMAIRLGTRALSFLGLVCGRGACTIGVVVAAIAMCASPRPTRAQVEGPGDPVPQVPDGLVVSQDRSGYALSLSPLLGGPQGVFYRTARPIENARTIVIPAVAIPTPEDPNPPAPTQPTVLALWNERQGGELVACRAIRFGGRAGPDGTWRNGDVDEDGAFDAGFAPIGEIDYRLLLRYAKFDPVGLPGQGQLPGVGEPPVPAGLRDSDVPGGCTLYIVQFWTEAIEEFRQSVEAAGGDLLGYLPDHAYIARLEGPAVDGVRALPCVRWVGACHPGYRVSHVRGDRLAHLPAEMPPAERYNIHVFEPGNQRAVADRIAATGGTVNLLVPGGYMLSATLTLGQLLEIVRMNEVTSVSLWGPTVLAMDKVRTVSGANYVETLGFTGAGVRGEVMDADLEYPQYHQDFSTSGVQPHGDMIPGDSGDFNKPHGACVYGIIFGNGTGDALARGMLPGAAGGGIFAWFNSLDPPNPDGRARWDHTAELVDPSGGYRAVFQSNSWGTTSVPEEPCTQPSPYNDASWELDRIVLNMDLLICQGQGNFGESNESDSLAEAYSKNVVSVGGVCHKDTATNDDDEFFVQTCMPLAVPTVLFGPCDYVCPQDPATCSPAPSGPCQEATLQAPSYGPTCDGRTKPDLHFFYHRIRTTAWRPLEEQTAYTCYFGGTSASTPQVAGCFGLLFQMWHSGVFPGFPVGGPGIDVFASRPHCATAKAIMINTAFQYDFTGPDFPDITRMKQGWGRPNVQNIVDRACNMFIVNETDVLAAVGVQRKYNVVPAPGGTQPLKVTLVYTDPPASLIAGVDRINDLSLQVRAPNGTVYWGNHGLVSGLWSQPGGTNADTINTVKNVFIPPPVAQGTWRVTVTVNVLGGDAHLETAGTTDVDYALVVSGVTATCASRIGDWDRNGTVDLDDFEGFLNAFIRGDADCDYDGITTSADFFQFMDSFLAPSEAR